MGKRSERFSGKALGEKIKDLTGKEVQLILWEGATYYGDLLEAEGDKVRIRDKNAHWYNRRQHTHDFEINDIREIIVDRLSQW